MTDQFTEFYSAGIEGSYDCIDRIVLNAYNPYLQSGGGFRVWWRTLMGDDHDLDDTHLMRFAGHFSRRVKAFAADKKIPVVYCKSDDRKDELFKQYVPQDANFTGMFCIFVNRASASVIEAQRFANNGLNIRKKNTFVNFYAFHIIDEEWGHIIIRFCPHPPFSAMVILNGHEYVERAAIRQKIEFTKEDNCFTNLSNAPALCRIADSMIGIGSDEGRLRDVCERWIYSCCLCFALRLAEQERTNFHYAYSIYQMEYSRNLLFTRGTEVDSIFNGVIDRTRSKLNIRTVKTIFGSHKRPHQKNAAGKKRIVQVTVEKPVYDLTVFKVYFDALTVKIYSKGERVLRFEATVHNAARLKCKRSVSNFGEIAGKLRDILYRFMDTVHCVDCCYISSTDFKSWYKPTGTGNKRVGGIDLHKPRTEAVMESLIALSIDPAGITTSKLAKSVSERLHDKNYGVRQAAYDLKKFRAKKIVCKKATGRTYEISSQNVQSMAAYTVLEERVLVSVIEHLGHQQRGKYPNDPEEICYRKIQNELCNLFSVIKIAA